ncbi:MAG: CDP-glucose 4,6-dehydratase [Gemmatimonadetes bacterium]|nr:CDP-glucose 4,6-dehydratase [Gemmatimonadota bacterium]
MTPSFWAGKRVLVTGHTGFKGSWLALWLQALGAEVTGYSLAPPSTPSLFQLADVAGGMKSVEGDVRDLERLAATVRSEEPEVVVHMAAQSLVRQSYSDPVETYATNVMGTVHLLEAVRRTPSVRAALVVTSDKCYENREWVWGYRENEPMGGFDPYSNSKGCAELVTSAYRSSFFRPGGSTAATAVASARAGNVIGGGDWAADRLIPDMLRAFLAGEPVRIRNPHAIRPWQHVLEPLAGYLRLAERLCEGGGDYAEGWNFGADDRESRPVSWIVERLTALWGEGARWELDAGEHPHEAHYLKLDCSKARERLGWTPRLPLEAALEWIVEWYRAYRSGDDVRGITEAQISRYQDELSR